LRRIDRRASYCAIRALIAFEDDRTCAGARPSSRSFRPLMIAAVAVDPAEELFELELRDERGDDLDPVARTRGHDPVADGLQADSGTAWARPGRRAGSCRRRSRCAII
jgi:hypothetical protein